MPSPLSFLGAGLGAVTGIGQLLAGAFMHPQRPDYTIPDVYNQQLALAQGNLNAGMPGFSQMMGMIRQNQGNLEGDLSRGSNSSASFLAGLGQLQQGSNSAYQRLGLENAQSYQGRLQNLENAQNIMGNQMSTQWEYNKYFPYMQSLQHKYSLIGGGLQSLNSAAQSMSGGGMSGNTSPDAGQLAGFGNMMGTMIGGGAAGGLAGGLAAFA